MKKSQYVRISKTIIQKLYSHGCWGAGSIYEIHLKRGIKEDSANIDLVLKALMKQKLILLKKHKFGMMYYLNPDRREKIGEIIKEKPRKRHSILFLLLGDFVW